MAKKHSALLMRTYVILVFCFMYLPIAVMIAFSFNESKSRSNFTGFTLGWYKSLFHNEMILSALGLSLVLALVSSIIATVLGTLATLGINSMSRKSQLIINNISYVPVVNPEIITGVSLMLLFVMAQNFGIGGESGIFGWPTLLIAHITFNLPYVILNVMPKLKQTDSSLRDAAMDLGCTPLQAFFKVTLHEIAPGIVSGAIMAFTMSLDDFVISYFVSGLDFVTLPVEIYSYTKKPLQPKIYALFTLLFQTLHAFTLVQITMTANIVTNSGRGAALAVMVEIVCYCMSLFGMSWFRPFSIFDRSLLITNGMNTAMTWQTIAFYALLFAIAIVIQKAALKRYCFVSSKSE